MHQHEKKALDRIAANLRVRFPEKISAAYAFGSRVRGDHGVWSDFDLLVVVREKTPALEAEIIGLIVEEERQAGLSFSPVVKDTRAFEREKGLQTPFYENLVREGVLL